jgi:hypothetical protein
MHIRSLQLLDFRDHFVETIREVGGRLTAFAPVAPDIPWSLGVEALVLPALADLRGEQAFVCAVIPFFQICCGFDEVVAFQVPLICLVEEESKCFLGALEG